ncbi:MAG: hypothetical protein IKI84_02445 [Clostridia bacterium]|nr:hypothetical protein [Clostridia bacterium]
MIRYSGCASSAWEDRLKSVLEEKQMNACRDRVFSWGSRSLFDDIGALEYAMIRQRSYEAGERAITCGPEKLRTRVLSQARDEAVCLGRGEDELIKKAVVSGWSAAVDDWDQIPALESLLKRLWCSVSFQDDDTPVLTVAPELREAILEGMKNEGYIPARDALFRLGTMLHSIRYIYGFVFPCPLVDQFIAESKKRGIEFDKKLTQRFIMAEFDYMYTSDGQLFLPHPALAYPEKILSADGIPGYAATEISFESMLGGMGGILPEEVPSVTCLKGVLMGGIRPESDLNEAVDDLRFMAKQGAGLKDMTRIMKSYLAVMPSGRMIDALERVRQEAVLWTGCLSSVRN